MEIYFQTLNTKFHSRMVGCFSRPIKCRKKEEEKKQYSRQDVEKPQVSKPSIRASTTKEQKSSKGSMDTGKMTVLTEDDKRILKEKGFVVENAVSFGCSGSLYIIYYKPTKKFKSIKMAVKVVDRALIADRYVTKFLPREIAIVSELNHPNIIQCHTIMDINTKCLFVLRFAENGDLLDYLGKTGVADETQGRLWVRQILLALDYLHNKLIAHRDIKCENLLVTQNLNIMLADFGFARKWVDADGEDVLSDTYCGSVSYAAPEILAGKPYCPKRVDVWSLGVVTFVMFNLAKPFAQNVPAEVLLAQKSRNYRWNSKGNRVSGNAKAFTALMLEPTYTVRPFPYQLLDEYWMREDPALLKILPYKKPTK